MSGCSIHVHVCIVVQEEDMIMEATEGLAEANSIATESVQAFAQLADSDRVRDMLLEYTVHH